MWYVVAWGENTSDAFGAHWTFKVQQLSNHFVVTACIEPGMGCVHPRANEVVNDQWTPSSLLAGLPTFEMVKLPRVAGSTFLGMTDEDHGHELVGSRSFDGLFGEWPSHAWAKVAYTMTHCCVSYHELYHFEGDRWRLVYAPRKYGHRVSAVIPWQRGVAVVADLEAHDPNNLGETRLLHLGGARSRVLLPWGVQRIWTGVSQDALVAVQMAPPSGHDFKSEVRNINLWRWTSADATPTRQELGALGVDPALTVFDAWIGDSVTLHVRGESGPDQWLSFTHDGLWHAQAPRPCGDCRDPGGAPELVALGPPWPESVSLHENWRIQGRWWATAHPDESRTLLLSDRPTQTVWALPAESSCPGKPTCFP